MINLTMNIGHKSVGGESYTTLNVFPMCYEFETIGELFDWLRNSMVDIMTWATEYYIPRKLLRIFMRVDINNFYYEYVINCSNIREYNALMHLSDDEIKLACNERIRDYNIGTILND